LISLQKLLLEGVKLNKTQKKDIEKFLIIKIEDGKIKPVINNWVYDDYIKTAGWHILFSNTISDAEIANQLYHRKDVVEKSFDKLKNKLSLNRIRVHSSNKMQSKLLISFISNILISYIYKQIKKSNLGKKYTLTDVFNEIKSLKKVKINSKNIYKPITKEIKQIFAVCNIKIPKI
jgi:hypothetical protein